MPVIIKNKITYGSGADAVALHDDSPIAHEDIRELIDDIEERLSALENIDVAEGGAY